MKKNIVEAQTRNSQLYSFAMRLKYIANLYRTYFLLWYSEKSGQTLQSRRQQQQQEQQQQQQQEANQPAAAAVQNGDARQVNKSCVQCVIHTFKSQPHHAIETA